MNEVAGAATPAGGSEVARRGDAWTEERGTSDEGRRHLKAPRLSGGSGGSPPRPNTDARSRTDTRGRIQQIAVELFTEHGYEGTSLREIAERLGVTKAALYYHFKSKEDIIQSLVEDYQGQMDALIGWARSHPRNAETRREILSRYMSIVAERDQIFRMLHQNQASLNTMATALRTLRTAPLRLADQLVGPGASLRERARATMALGAMNVGWMYLADQAPDRHELSEIVCGIASELAQCRPPGSEAGEPGGQ